jgi:hypothetical protein
VGHHGFAARVVAVSVVLLWAVLTAVDPTPMPMPPPTPSATPSATPSSATGPSPPAPVVHVVDEKERASLEQTDHVRLSLPTQGDVDAWKSPGLRVQLGYGRGLVHGFGPAPSFDSQSFLLRPSVRIDRYWAVGIAMLYGTGPNGLRWSVTAEPTFFPWRQLALSVGVGYGGLIVDNPNAPGGAFQGVTPTVSRDLNAGEILQNCAGSALSSVVRADYLFVVGALFATGPFAEASAQRTHCQETFGTDAETGQTIALSQWWQQGALNFGWWFAWR